MSKIEQVSQARDAAELTTTRATINIASELGEKRTLKIHGTDVIVRTSAVDTPNDGNDTKKRLNTGNSVTLTGEIRFIDTSINGDRRTMAYAVCTDGTMIAAKFVRLPEAAKATIKFVNKNEAGV